MARLKFRRQHPIGSYVLDFFCAEAALAVEIDGAAHDLPRQADKDAVRDRALGEAGIRVLRFAARDVLDRTARQDVLDTIRAACGRWNSDLE